jgi:PAS domain S-box-containing protein
VGAAGDIHASSALLFPVILMFASLILPRPPFIQYALLTVLSIGLIIYAENQRWLTPYTPDPPEWPLFVSYTVMIISAAFIARLVTESLQNSLHKSQEQEQKLATQKEILDRVGQAVVACHLDNTIIYWNKAATSYYGWEAQDALGRKYDDVVPATYDAKQSAEIRQALRTGRAWSGEMTIQRKTGETLPIIGTIAPLHDEGEAVTGWVGIGTDISALKTAQAEILNLNAQLEQRISDRTAELETAYRELEMVSYSTSHTLRHPARGVAGLANILARDHSQELSEEARSILHKMQWSAISMGTVIDDLLEFLRIGKIPLKVMDTSPRLAVDQALYEIFEGRVNTGLQINIAELPNCRADLSLLGIVYKHLLDNAIKFARTPMGHCIDVGAEQRTGQTVYFVKDNGIGFDMKFAERIFGIFEQLAPPGAYDGSGVGLALAQRIIHRHGGKIWAESEPDKGATFYFTLDPA